VLNNFSYISVYENAIYKNNRCQKCVPDTKQIVKFADVFFGALKLG